MRTGRPKSYTPEQAAAMVAAYAVNQSLAETARLFGSTPMTVRKALRSEGINTTRRLKSFIGSVFNNRRVLFLVKRGKNGITIWRWKCLKCSKTGQATIASLKTRKCRHCSHKGTAAENKDYLGCGEINQPYYLKLYRAARRRGLKWTVTPGFLWQLFLWQGRRCALSGRLIQFDENWTCNKPSAVTASLDRKDSSGGYTENNVWWIHKDFQAMKMDMTVDDFLSVCNEVVAHHQRTI